MNNRFVVIFSMVALLVVIGITIATFLPETTDGDDGAKALLATDSQWNEVQLYVRADTAWHDRIKQLQASEEPEELKQEKIEEAIEDRPSAEAAVAAALAIVRSDSKQEHTIDAAQFLIDKSMGAKERGQAMLAGMVAMAKFNPDYTDWAKAMLIADVYTPPGFLPELDEFFETFHTRLEHNREAVAIANYYAATRRMTLANWIKDSPSDRTEHRNRAIKFATGMSRGVENKELMRRQPKGDNGETLPYPTFAQVEQELLFLLNNLTVGAITPDAQATNLAGVKDALSNYRGRVVLLDFWATWCVPCIEALPKLDALKQELPNDSFEVISINTDETIDSLNDFLEKRPMPWIHWYVGENSDLLKSWSIRGFPTYVLINGDGTLVAKQHGLNKAFLDLIESSTLTKSR